MWIFYFIVAEVQEEKFQNKQIQKEEVQEEKFQNKQIQKEEVQEEKVLEHELLAAIESVIVKERQG